MRPLDRHAQAYRPAPLTPIDGVGDSLHRCSMKKIRFKSGSFEFEMETDDLEVDLGIAMSALEPFLASAPKGGGGATDNRAADLAPGAISVPDTGDVSAQHMNTYIAKLGANTGRKILQAASLHLSLNDGRESFSRDELFARAREAREWKGDYANQQATNVARMVRAGELIERSSGVYTVPTKVLETSKQALFS